MIEKIVGKVLKSIKDKGFDILDFIKGGGLSGLLAKTFL